MKKLLTLLSLALAAVAAWAQPILVGHRGSGYGLENSEESFRKGIELGYKYLETDVKFCKGDILVCSHDDDTKRLGGTKTLASSTLEELQSETLAQTRSGVKYTGRICSMKEYLQICKDGGVGPLIELKWTAGINSNDCSKIPLLIAQIDEMEMRDKCIILTSMKPCLEYIRTNYPDIELQFLTGQYWSNHFDWCVEHGIDVDIQAGYFDKSTVQKFHDKGLKVNMWTTNDEAGYRSYGNMGCDFITTDRLDAANLPELDPEITFPPNTVDFPNTRFTPSIKSRYELTGFSETPYPEVLAGKRVKRAVKGPEGWYVLALDATGKSTLFHIADSDGSALEVPSDGAEFSDIAMTADEMLIACDKALPGKVFNIYIGASPRVPLELFADSRFRSTVGERMTVSGTSRDLIVYTTSESDGGESILRQCFKYGDLCGSATAAVQSKLPDNYVLNISPWSRDNIIIGARGTAATEYTFSIEGKDASLVPFAAMSPYDSLARGDGMSFMRYGRKIYALLPSEKSGPAGMFAIVCDATGGLGERFHAVSAPFELGQSVGPYVASSMRSYGEGDNRISVFVEGAGVFNARFDESSHAEAPVDLGLTLERLWIQSNTEGIFPGNIDGTDAQQGTVAGGLFYINNCSKKLIHVFDSNGHAGTLPGGSGWGCASDDAGNIIVRDDKLTGDTHSFLIYPAGTTPAAPSDAVRLTVRFSLEGQVNFISASGNVLGAEGGHIYLFPKKQSQATITRIVEGREDAVFTSDELGFIGTAAAIVVPVGDNREDWYYQVRANGIKRYIGGENIDVLTGRTSTKAPGRNNTGGFAVIEEGGNRLLIHNSGENYKGGFTVRDLTLDKVIASVEPIGKLGYEEGGNYSTFNWLFAARNAKADYTVYQYCPANGLAAYRLYNAENGGIGDLSASGTITYNGLWLSAPGADSIEVYDLTGALRASAKCDRLLCRSLPAGVYIARTSSGAALKFGK